ncbi:MAG: hypothetical protein Kow0080_05960 [Candidatus Promineifilaceae bacterium]
MQSTAVPNNQLAVISLVSGIIAWVVGGLAGCVLFFVFPPIALCTGAIFFFASLIATITGHMARRRIQESGGLEGGDSLAVAGLIMGWLGIAANILLLCLFVVGIFGLTLMGPQVGNVFSDIIRDLEMTPVP